jgi:ATP-dependent exoDNAse (exonuclease V) alpha subunit
VSAEQLEATAAQELETGSGVPSSTLASLTGYLDSGEVQLHDQVVVVVDEAGMVGTRDIAPLLTAAAAARAKVVLVGDPRQLPEITAGGLLGHLESRRRAITLIENHRQTDPTERAALAELRAGDVDEAVALLRERGVIVHGPNSETVRDGMVGDWWTHRQHGSDALMLARRNADVDDLNRRARRLVADAGELSGDPIEIVGRPFQIGDQIVCLRNDYRSDVRNGTTATITNINHQQRSVTIDTDHGVRQLDSAYLAAGLIRHGYAVTVHKAQGRTADHGLLLGTDDVTRESSYVGLSRGRESNRLYVVSTDCDDDLEHHARADDRDDPRRIVLDALHATSGKQLASDLTPGHDNGADIGW